MCFKNLLAVNFLINCFVHGSYIHLVDFYDTHVNDIWLFQNKYLEPYRSFDLNSVF